MNQIIKFLLENINEVKEDFGKYDEKNLGNSLEEAKYIGRVRSLESINELLEKENITRVYSNPIYALINEDFLYPYLEKYPDASEKEKEDFLSYCYNNFEFSNSGDDIYDFVSEYISENHK